MGFRGLGCGVQGSGGLGCRGLGLRLLGSGIQVWGSGGLGYEQVAGLFKWRL